MRGHLIQLNERVYPRSRKRLPHLVSHKIVDEKRRERGICGNVPVSVFFWELYDGKEKEVGKKEE